MTENEIQLAQNLQRLIKREKITVKTLARKINTNDSTLYNYFNGVMPQGLIALMRLAEYFELSLEELLFNKEKVSPHFPKEQGIEGKYEVTVKKIE